MDRVQTREGASDMTTRILTGDARKVLAELADGSVGMCLTSPPYYGLRDYGHGDQIGLEATPGGYVEELVTVFREVRRVLRDDGTLWLNNGDSYASGGGTGPQFGRGQRFDRHHAQETLGDVRRWPDSGIKPKDLIGIPWRKPLRWDSVPFWQCIGCSWRGVGGDMPTLDDGFGAWVACPSCHAGAFAHARRRVFCTSLADVFDNVVDPTWRADLFRLIAETLSLDWLVLTKRIGNAEKMIDEAVTSLYDSLPDEHPAYSQRPWKHVWLGATIVNQAEADRDIPKLLATPTAVRFLPLLGPVNLEHIGRYTNGGVNMDALRGTVTNGILAMSPSECSSMVSTTFRNPRIDWVIAGGESGLHARAAHPDWFRSLRDQCAGAGVPILFKQWGEWRPPAKGEEFDTSMGRAQQIPAFIVAPAGTVHCFENDGTRGAAAVMLRVGKKAAGRLLDGVEHQAFPASTAFARFDAGAPLERSAAWTAPPSPSESTPRSQVHEIHP